jgi:hypothetical protein
MSTNPTTKPTGVIDLVPMEVNGSTIFVEASEAPLPVLATPDGKLQATTADGDPGAAVALPSERFAATASPEELARIIASVQAAEEGHSSDVVLATPDGRLKLQNQAGGETLTAQLPSERFAASLAAERREVAEIDPTGRFWSHITSNGLKGWVVRMTNDFNDTYMFFIESEPSGVYQAQLVKPAVPDMPSHTRHMVSNGVVCLNAHLGYSTLKQMHGALAKWALYTSCQKRYIPAGISV